MEILVGFFEQDYLLLRLTDLEAMFSAKRQDFLSGIGIWLRAEENLESSHLVSVIRDFVQGKPCFISLTFLLFVW